MTMNGDTSEYVSPSNVSLKVTKFQDINSFSILIFLTGVSSKRFYIDISIYIYSTCFVDICISAVVVCTFIVNTNRQRRSRSHEHGVHRHENKQ